jgi:dephospho-CoA kinase
VTIAPIPVIGILGGIGSGKTSVARELAKHGGHLIVADDFGHEALRQPELKQQIIARFGREMIDAQGEIDRGKLGGIVFADAKQLRTLEEVVFPYISLRIDEAIAQVRRRSDVGFIILDAAVMLEAGWHDVCDQLIFVDAPHDLRLRRVHAARGWSDADLHAREALQLPLDEKRRRAVAVIDNSTTPQAMADQVAQLVRWWSLSNPTRS